MKMGITLSNHQKNLWFRRHFMSLPIRLSLLVLATVSFLIRQRSQLFLITRLLPVNEVIKQPIQFMYNTMNESSDSTTFVLSISSDNISDVPSSSSFTEANYNHTLDVTEAPSATATALPVSSSVYLFPIQPMHYNISAILRQSIGTSILRHPTKNPLQNCAPTIQFQLKSSYQRINHIDTLEYTIHAMMMVKKTQKSTNMNNKKQITSIIPKPMGGDEMYIEWVSADDSTDMGVAHITDNQNGTYSLKFIRPPLLQYNYTKHHQPNDNDRSTKSYGRLTIYFDYTCDIGRMFAPKKNKFRRAGEIHLSLHQNNIPKPYIHDFIPPNSGDINHDVEGNDNIIDLSKYHTVIAFGDSLMLQLVRRYKLGGFWSPNVFYEENINQCLSNSDDTKMAIEKFQQWHSPQIIDAATRHNESVAVILGSAVWDAMRGCVRSDFIDHRQAIRQFITKLRTLYPHIHFYWKSPSAIQLHRRSSLEELMDNQVWLQRSRYISDGVPRRIYTEQKVLMKELQVPFLDLFDAYYLSAPWTLPGDARHYEDDISFILLSYYWPGLDRTKVYYNTNTNNNKADH